MVLVSMIQTVSSSDNILPNRGLRQFRGFPSAEACKEFKEKNFFQQPSFCPLPTSRVVE